MAALQDLKFLPETILPTLLITNQNQLNSLVRTLETLQTVWSFINFRGEPGRLSKCLHILMNVRNTIVVIDMLAFHDETAVWKLLKLPLFENAALEKVFFAPEVVADYLWHQHSIRMANITSLKVLHDLIGSQQFPLLDSLHIGDDNHLKLEKRLVVFLDHYLANVVHPLEITILFQDYNYKPPYQNECVKARKKQLTLEVKWLPQLHNVMKKLAMKGIEEYIDNQLALE